MWRAIRLVVDTGVHSQHWTRQQMVDYFHQYSGLDETNIQSEVDRYIAWPAQALGYKMGQLKILELRDRAKSALGPRFDLKRLPRRRPRLRRAPAGCPRSPGQRLDSVPARSAEAKPVVATRRVLGLTILLKLVKSINPLLFQ